MTTHYIDITLLPDPEFSPVHLLSALVSKLHRAFVQGCTTDIGVSYPRHAAKTLGSVLRLHGTSEALAKIMDQNWLTGMRDHTHVSEIRPVPSDVQHCIVQRRQFKTNAERLRRRRMQRKEETAEQAYAAIPDSVERCPNVPFVHLRSSSTGESFCMFIEHVNVPAPVGGTFNSYGLGSRATIPWF